MQQTRETQKRLEHMTEKLATAGEKIVHPVEGIYNNIPVRVHLIDPDLDAMFMQKRANVLKESQPEYAHLLVNKNTIVVALNTSQVQEHTANSVRYKYRTSHT